MAPEILAGSKRYFLHAKLGKIGIGDIVLVRSSRADVEYLCRVVALDGDKVQIVAGKFLVNGQTKIELKPRLSIPEDLSFKMQEVEVRPNFFFCLNDNTQNTNDSRTQGIFARSQIVAKIFKPKFFF